LGLNPLLKQEQIAMKQIDLIVFLVFTGIVVVMGASFFRKKSSAHDFTSAGGTIPGWVVGMSILSTYISSISYLGNPGMSYSGNWNAFVFNLSTPIAAYIAARYFVPFYREQGSVSTYKFLEDRFGRWARVYASVCYLLTQISRIGSIMFLLALPMNMLLGWDIRTVIVVTGISIIFYSIMGGIRGVIWTEAIQGFIMIGGAIACLAILLFSMPEGPSQTFEIAMRDDKFSLGSFSLTDFSTSTFWVCMIYGIFINMQNFGIDQNYVQRYHTTKTLKAAKRSVLSGSWILIPVSAVFFMIGTALYAYYQVNAGVLPEGIKGDQVFPFFIVNQLPDGMTGLLIASIFAAGMSTVATGITSSATIIYTDYYHPVRPDASERSRLVVLKLSGVIIGVLGIIVSMMLIHVDSILDAWWKLSSIFSGGMLGLFLLGYIVRKSRNVDAMLGISCGVLVIAWISAWKWLNLPDPRIHEYLAVVLGTMTIFLVGFLSCRFIPKFRKQ